MSIATFKALSNRPPVRPPAQTGQNIKVNTQGVSNQEENEVDLFGFK